MKAKQVRKILNISQPTLSKYVKNGLIRVIKINPYNYIYNEEDVYKLIGLKKEKHNKINISYSRVSTQKQKEQLIEQENRIYNYCINKGIDLNKQFSDIGSGMYSNRRKLNKIIKELKDEND